VIASFYGCLPEKVTLIRRFFALLLKKTALEKFFAIRGCGLPRTPYNAPPLTGNND
jgi:hypothetical protein